MKLKYIKDICGNEILTDENEVHQVMMDWEKPYMEESINKLNPHGDVLEIGFGMGFSASKMCEFSDVKSYTVIECSPIVWEKFEEWKKLQRETLKINLIKGRWQDMLETLDKFDCIYFDDYNGESFYEVHTRFSKFMYKIFLNHSKIGTKICFYSTSNKNPFEKLKCIKYNVDNYEIDIPKNCKYASGDKMYIPIIEIISEPDENIKEIFDNLNQPGTLNINNKQRAEIEEKIKKYKLYQETPKKIYCNLMIIDNFYNNAMETRNYILTRDFKVRGNYPGKRTESHANEHLKTMIEGYIQHFAGKITRWPTDKEAYNGAFQYTTSRDRTWLHTDSWNNWAGVLYLTPNAPVTAGTGIFKFRDGTRTSAEMEARGNKEIIDNHSQDYTKWELVDRVGNVFNRLVLFNSTQFHASLDYFGTCKEDARLFQVFFFSTER